MDDKKDYSVKKEITLVLAIGAAVGLVMLVVGIGVVEFLKH